MERNIEIRFLADAMLGKLAKWLRILGYDTIYMPCFDPLILDRAVADHRCLLSRHTIRTRQYPNSVFIQEDQVGEQLSGLTRLIPLTPEKSRWFSRCLRCNALLEDAKMVGENPHVPDYVLHSLKPEIRYCSTCKQYYWPGSHKKRMIAQLERWGFF